MVIKVDVPRSEMEAPPTAQQIDVLGRTVARMKEDKPVFEHDGRSCACTECETNRERLRSSKPPKPPKMKRVRCVYCCELIGLMSATVLEQPSVFCMACGLSYGGE